MARDGYLILDSDLHMMEPDDLWARYLEGRHRENPPRFFGGQQRKLSESTEDKGNADTIMGMEVQGLAIPAHATANAPCRSNDRQMTNPATKPSATKNYFRRVSMEMRLTGGIIRKSRDSIYISGQEGRGEGGRDSAWFIL